MTRKLVSLSPTRKKLDAFVPCGHRCTIYPPFLWVRGRVANPPMVTAHQPITSETDSDVDLGAEADVHAGIALDDDDDEDNDAPGFVSGDIDPEV